MKESNFLKVLMLLFFSLSSCDKAVDCVLGIKPNLLFKDLKNGAVYDFYNDSMTFEMVNTNRSNFYISELSMDGSLPPNIKYELINDRTIDISGIPTNKGTYEFTFTIRVSENQPSSNGKDGMCTNISSEKYKIIIY